MGLRRADPDLNTIIQYGVEIWASEVDIDNDGTNDVRLYVVAGTAHCTYSWFFRRARDGTLRRMSERGYDDLHEEARYCGGGLSFLRYRGKVFTLETYDRIFTVLEGSTSGLHGVCSFWNENLRGP